MYFQFDKNFTANNHKVMISFTIATFLKSYEDPYVLQEVQEIINVLAANEFCIVALQERLVPTLVRNHSDNLLVSTVFAISFLNFSLFLHTR